MKNGDSTKCIVIVDGYSNGGELARKLLARNVACIHLNSTKKPLVGISFDPSSYDADLGYADSVDDAIDMITPLGANAVIAGSAHGVDFAEAVSYGLSLPANRIETRPARRDPIEMRAWLKRAGLMTICQVTAWSSDIAHEWAGHFNAWPVMIRSVTDIGSDAATICHDHDEIEAACARLLHTRSDTGAFRHSLILEPMVPGERYIVNTVSRHGRHHVCDAWHLGLTERAGAKPAPIAMHLLDPSEPHAQEMFDHARRALDALGIDNSAASIELQLTSSGPLVLAAGAHMMGSAMDQPSYCRANLTTQAGIYAAVLAGCEKEREAIFASPHYRFSRHLSKLAFHFEEAGEIGTTGGLARLPELASFHSLYRPLRRGMSVSPAADAFACGGAMYLVHEDCDQIGEDIARIRQWERAGLLYELKQAPYAQNALDTSHATGGPSDWPGAADRG